MEAEKAGLLGEPEGEAQPGLSQNTPEPLCVYKPSCSSMCPSARLAVSRRVICQIHPPVASLFYLYLFKPLSLFFAFSPSSPPLIFSGFVFSSVSYWGLGYARLRRARHGAGRAVEGSWGPLAHTSKGNCILPLGLMFSGPREGNGARPFPAARLFVAKCLEDGTAFGGCSSWPTLSRWGRGSTFESPCKWQSGHCGGAVHKGSCYF